MRIEVTARRRTGVALAMLAAILFIGAGTFPGSLALAQDTDATGVIAGSVTADHGDVRALRVKAHDTVRRIAYTVYTQNGRYRDLQPAAEHLRRHCHRGSVRIADRDGGGERGRDDDGRHRAERARRGTGAGRGGARGVGSAQLRRRHRGRPHGGDRRFRHALSAAPGA